MVVDLFFFSAMSLTKTQLALLKSVFAALCPKKIIAPSFRIGLLERPIIDRFVVSLVIQAAKIMSPRWISLNFRARYSPNPSIKTTTCGKFS